MDLKDKFTTIDEDDMEDKSAIFYMKEEDMRVLLKALERAQPLSKSDKKLYNKMEQLKRQLRHGLNQ